jgi:hypothetical protein
MSKEAPLNQTAFSAEEPLYDSFGENTSVPQEPETPQEATKKLRTLGIVAGVVLFVLSLVILLFSLKSGPKDEVAVESSPTPVPQLKTGPTQQKLTELQRDFEAADPAAQDLFFPPVNMKLQLDSKL